MKILLILLELVVHFFFFTIGQLEITTDKDYFMPFVSVEINCTSAVSLDSDILFDVGRDRDVRVRYNNETEKCTFANRSFSFRECNETCKCDLNGRSAVFVYFIDEYYFVYYRKEITFITFSCKALSYVDNQILRNQTYIQRAFAPLTPTMNKGVDGRLEVDRHLVIDCTSSKSYPAPLFIWYLGSYNVTDNATTIASEHKDGDWYRYYSSTSQLNMVVEREIRGLILTCRVVNPDAPEGISSSPLIILVKGGPDIPELFSIVSVTETTITIQMSAGYDGGYQQTFVLCYRRYGMADFIETRIPTHDNNTIEQYNVTGLSIATLYEIEMYAENKINISRTTYSIKVLTLGMHGFDDQGLRRKVAGLAGGFSTLTVVLLVILCILFFKIYLMSKKQKSVMSEKRCHFESKQNGYENSTTIQISSIDVSFDNEIIYEDLGDREAPNVYEEMNTNGSTHHG